MARGKHSAIAARHAIDARDDIIQRLTSDLADQKVRARLAEQRANQLEGADRYLRESSEAHRAVVDELTSKLKWWGRVAKEDEARRQAAIHEVWDTFFDDADLRRGTREDERQFLETRYPKLMSALTAGTSARHNPHDAVRWRRSSSRPFERRLSAEKLREFQRRSGQRGVVENQERDVADLWIDLLDAHQAGFTRAEVLEFVEGGRTA